MQGYGGAVPVPAEFTVKCPALEQTEEGVSAGCLSTESSRDNMNGQGKFA